MPGEGVPAAPEVLLRRMYEVFSTDERDAFVRLRLAPDVDWPDVLDGVHLHGREEVRAYWARQFAAGVACSACVVPRSGFSGAT